MPTGGQGNFAGTGGYGGQFPGFGGASAGYTGGYGNPSSVGGGTAGQTYNSVPYANTLNKYNQSLSNYSGNTNSAGNTPAQQATVVAAKKKLGIVPGAKLTPAQQIALQQELAPVPQAKPAGLPFSNPPQVVPGLDLTPNPLSASPQHLNYGVGSYPNPQGAWNLGSHPSTQTGMANGGGFSGFANDVMNGISGVGSAIGTGFSGMLGDAVQGVTGGPKHRQFGGPVNPGQQYTVGENGPETLQMGAQGGQVIPNNPVDRLGGMNPGMMQALFQLMQQQRPQMNPGQAPVGQPAPQMPQPPQMRPPMGPGPGGPGGGFRLGDWRNRMGIEGLSRPPQSMGFGGSGLGISGILPHMAQRSGFGGGPGMG